jgi:hypothetical protein
MPLVRYHGSGQVLNLWSPHVHTAPGIHRGAECLYIVHDDVRWVPGTGYSNTDA